MLSQSVEHQFHAAVEVVRNLPRNGCFEPSSAVQLNFEAYFLQATEGSCRESEPPIWKPSARARHDAWAKLGDLSRNDAKVLYVEQLKQIMDVMALSDELTHFYRAAGPLLDSDQVDASIGQETSDNSSVNQLGLNGECEVEQKSTKIVTFAQPIASSLPKVDDPVTNTELDAPAVNNPENGRSTENDNRDGDSLASEADQFFDSVDVPVPANKDALRGDLLAELADAYSEDLHRECSQQSFVVDAFDHIQEALTRFDERLERIQSAVESSANFANRPWWQSTHILLGFVVVWPIVTHALLSRLK